jgi:hypothetical protein
MLCHNSSRATILYQWRFNGTDIPNATNNTLLVPNLSTSQTGPYSVRVSNATGSVESQPAQLTVLNPANSLSLSSPTLTARGFQVSVIGLAGRRLTLEYSADLGTWLEGPTVENSSGVTIFVDLTAMDVPRRFYRVKGANAEYPRGNGSRHASV